MCVFCEQYGDPEHENGLWYLNPKNYARNMYKLRPPGTGFKGSEASLEADVGLGPVKILEATEKGMEEFVAAVNRAEEEVMKKGATGQVVPLKDAEKVLEIASPMALMACLCRQQTRGKEERNEHEYTCMGFGVGMFKWERWPERYKGGAHFLGTDEAKAWVQEMDKRGFVHMLMPFGAPFIGGFCQCDYPDCGMIRAEVDFGYGLIKSHYVAKVDYEVCNGCGICAQRCHVGALKFEVTTRKANIDPLKCYGCGLCETGCPRGAINLVDRVSVPALREVW